MKQEWTKTEKSWFVSESPVKKSLKDRLIERQDLWTKQGFNNYIKERIYRNHQPIQGSKINLKNSYANIHKLTRVDPPRVTNFKIDLQPKKIVPELDLNKKDRILREEYEQLIEK